jgi:hypothetical protein
MHLDLQVVEHMKLLEDIVCGRRAPVRNCPCIDNSGDQPALTDMGHRLLYRFKTRYGLKAVQ